MTPLLALMWLSVAGGGAPRCSSVGGYYHLPPNSLVRGCHDVLTLLPALQPGAPRARVIEALDGPARDGADKLPAHVLATFSTAQRLRTLHVHLLLQVRPPEHGETHCRRQRARLVAAASRAFDLRFVGRPATEAAGPGADWEWSDASGRHLCVTATRGELGARACCTVRKPMPGTAPVMLSLALHFPAAGPDPGQGQHPWAAEPPFPLPGSAEGE